MNGLLTLSNSILCKKEVLGESFEVNISGIKACIFFPEYPNIDPTCVHMPPLVPPNIGKSWRRGEDYLRWGYPMMDPPGNSCVELLALSVECSKDENEEYARRLYSSIINWEYAFIDYLKIETKQHIKRNNNIKRETCNLELFDDHKYIYNNKDNIIYVTIPESECYASKTQIQHAIEFANSGKELFLEYQMLVSSYDARCKNKNRQAIIDACSAIEICLVKYIQEFCDNNSRLNSRYILENKFRSLGDRIKLAKMIDSSFPETDCEILVVQPRNDIAHNRIINPTNETTDKLISCVEQCMEHYSKGIYF